MKGMDNSLQTPVRAVDLLSLSNCVVCTYRSDNVLMTFSCWQKKNRQMRGRSRCNGYECI